MFSSFANILRDVLWDLYTLIVSDNMITVLYENS